MRILSSILLLLFLSVSVFAQKSKEAYNEGVGFIKAKKYTEATNSFKTAVNESKAEGRSADDIGKYVYYVGFAAYKGEDFKTAIAYLDSAVQMDQKPGKSYVMIADSYKSLNDNENYIKTLETAAQARPKDEDFPVSIGLYYYGLGAEQKTEAAKLTESNPAKCKEALLNAKAEFEKALPSLETAKKLIDAKLLDPKKDKKKEELESDLKKVNSALDAIKTSQKEITEAVAAIK